MFIPDQCYLSDLLPYDLRKKSKAGLRTALNEYLLLLFGSLEAVNALDLDALEKFDALVGENACQIRAIWISIIASKKEILVNKLRKKINQVKSKIYKLLEEKTISKLMNAEISLEELLVNEKLFVSLTHQETFVIHCFFLREVKSAAYGDGSLGIFLIKEKCIPKRLKKFGDVSSSFTDNLVSKLRKTSAKQSVQFIREYAKKSQDKNLIRMLSDKFTVNHNNHLLCTPMFWTYKAMLFAAKIEGIKLILHAKLMNKDDSGFKVSDECWFATDFSLDMAEEGLDLGIKKIDWDKVDRTPCVVVQGVICTKKKYSSF